MHCCLLAVNIEAHCDLALYPKCAPLAVAEFAQSNSTQNLGCHMYLLLAASCADFNSNACTAAAHAAQRRFTFCIKCQKHSNCACYNNEVGLELAQNALVAFTKGISSPAAAFWVSNLTLHSSICIPAQFTTAEETKKASLRQRSHREPPEQQQHEAMTIGHSPKGKEKS